MRPAQGFPSQPINTLEYQRAIRRVCSRKHLCATSASRTISGASAFIVLDAPSAVADPSRGWRSKKGDAGRATALEGPSAWHVVQGADDVFWGSVQPE